MTAAEQERTTSHRMTNRRNECLERVFERVITDARAVGAPITPRVLALAAGAAGWSNKHADLVRKENDGRPRDDRSNDQ